MVTKTVAACPDVSMQVNLCKHLVPRPSVWLLTHMRGFGTSVRMMLLKRVVVPLVVDLAHGPCSLAQVCRAKGVWVCRLAQGK